MSEYLFCSTDCESHISCYFTNSPRKYNSRKKRVWESDREERQTVRVYMALIREMCWADCICGLCLEPLNVRSSRDFNLFFPIGPSRQNQMESTGRLVPDLEHKCNIITWKHCTLFCSQCSWGTNLENRLTKRVQGTQAPSGHESLRQMAVAENDSKYLKKSRTVLWNVQNLAYYNSDEQI